MTRPVATLRSRSLPLLALVEAARIVFGTAGKRGERKAEREWPEPAKQMKLEGIR